VFVGPAARKSAKALAEWLARAAEFAANLERKP
jgi:hypothetical protein